MEIIVLLIAVSLPLVAIIAWLFFWAVDSGQFDDLESPATAVLMDDDDPRSGPRADSAGN